MAPQRTVGRATRSRGSSARTSPLTSVWEKGPDKGLIAPSNAGANLLARVTKPESLIVSLRVGEVHSPYGPPTLKPSPYNPPKLPPQPPTAPAPARLQRGRPG